MNIVLDTNCLLMSLSRRSAYYPVWRDFVDGKYTLCVTNEILAEYEEILTHAHSNFAESKRLVSTR
jgi:rRNA-processing protein FCF1